VRGVLARLAVVSAVVIGLTAPAARAQEAPPSTEAASTTAAPDPLGDLARLVAGLPAASCLTVSVDGDRVVDHQGSLPLVPASNQKLLTAAWALATAPELTFTTRVTATGLDGGRARVLHLVGGADPMLSTDAFAGADGSQYGGRWATSLDRLADRVVAAGVTEVGALLGDGSVLPRQPAIPQWRAAILGEGHTGPLGGLTVNHGFAYDPTDPAARRWSSDPAREAARHLAALLRERGVRVGWVGTAAAPATAVEVASVSSRPVRDLVHELLSESDNNTAEGLLQGIGRLAAGTDGSVAAGAQAVQQHLARVGLGEAGTVGVDGSGLSRDNRTTCHQLEQVLLAAGPGSDLEGSLAVSKALSGFLTTASGHEVSFAFVVNGANAPAIGTAAWSPLVQALSLL